MDDITTQAILESPCIFTKRPAAIHPDLRPLRRVVILLLLIDACRASVANLEQLHVLDWAIRNAESRQRLLEFLLGIRAPEAAIVRFDPSLDRAVCLAVGADLVSVAQKSRNGKGLPDFRISITPQGRKALDGLAPDTLPIERAFLRSLPNRLTQSDVSALFEWGNQG